MGTRKVEVGDMLDVIGDHEQPALTKRNIADALGVSRQTIQNHHKELEQHPAVRTGKISKATVYWLVEEPPTQRPAPTPEPAAEPATADRQTPDSQGWRDRLRTAPKIVTDHWRFGSVFFFGLAVLMVLATAVLAAVGRPAIELLVMGIEAVVLAWVGAAFLAIPLLTRPADTSVEQPAAESG